ncbi:hypothetical protein Skr01_23100 [Sphaerisporangium krabiense]|nr:hypothetical protein Skr01_23100 [Sphaerisporangium krabiense]
MPIAPMPCMKNPEAAWAKVAIPRTIHRYPEASDAERPMLMRRPGGRIGGPPAPDSSRSPLSQLIRDTEFFAPEFFAEAVRRRRHKWHTMIAEGNGTVLPARLDGVDGRPRPRVWRRPAWTASQ